MRASSPSRTDIPEPIRKLRAARRWPKGLPMPKPGAYRFNLKWTGEEIEQLRANYPEYGSRYCARLLGRTMVAITIKAARLHIVRQPYWTESDLEILRREYGQHGKRSSRRIAAEIGRTRLAVTQKAAELGLTVTPRRWTREELRLLRKYYHKKSLTELSAMLGHNTSSILAMASKRGLANPHGSLTARQKRAIAVRLGKKSMLTIAREVGVSPNRVRTEADRIGWRDESERHQRRTGAPVPPERAPSRNRKEWTPEEDATLRQLYPTHGARYVGALLGRAAKATAARAYRLGVNAAPMMRIWSSEDEEFLRRQYSSQKVPDLAIQLKRSESAVSHKARQLGLLSPRRGR